MNKIPLASITAIVLWCFSGLVYALGTRHVPLLPFITLSALTGTVTIVIFRLCRGESIAQLFLLPRSLFIAVFFGISVYQILIIAALSSAPDAQVAQVMLLNYLWPLWMVVFSILFLPTPVRRSLALAGAILAFTGVALSRGGSCLTLPNPLWPYVMTLTAGILWGLYCVQLKRRTYKPGTSGAAAGFLMCSLSCGTWASLTGQWSLASIAPSGWACIAVTGIITIGMGYYLWDIGLQRAAHVHLIAVLSYFIPIVSVLLIGLVLAESMTPFLLPGAGLIVLGAFLARKSVQPRVKNADK